MYIFKKLQVNLTFRSNSENLLTVIKELAIACGLVLTSGLGFDDMSGLARRGSTIGFHLLWHTVELAMNTRLCLL